MRNFYLAAAIIGTIATWFVLFPFFQQNGPDLPGFVAALFANPAAGAGSTDLIISIVVFWIWSFVDARRNAIRHWWLVLPASLTVGLALSLPLYLFMRETAKAV